MTYFIYALVFGVLVWAPGRDTWQALWIERWLVLTTGIAFLAIWRIRWRSWVFPIFLSYLFGIAAYSTASAHFHYNGITDKNPEMILMLKHDSLDALLTLWAMLLSFMLPYSQHWRKALKYSAALLCIGVIVQASVLSHIPAQVPFMSNPSMTGTFIALALFDTSWAFWGLGCLAILLTGSSTAILVWSVANLFYSRLWYFWATVLLCGAVQYPHFVALDNDRFRLWNWTYIWWDNIPSFHKIFGSGIATIRTWLPMIQALGGENLLKRPTVIWLHNDWFQSLFEVGYVGVGLGAFSLLILLTLAKRKSRALLLAFGAAMITNFPLHWPLHALLLWCVVREESIRGNV